MRLVTKLFIGLCVAVFVAGFLQFDPLRETVLFLVGGIYLPD